MEKHEIIQACLLQLRKLRIMEAKMMRLAYSCDDKIPMHHLMMLVHLTEDGPIPIRKIKEEFRVSASAATQLIDSLEKEHYIVKTRDEHDKRSVLISLSATGHQLVLQYHKQVEHYIERLIDYVGIEDIATSIRINEQIIKFNAMMEDSYVKDKAKK